MGFRNDRQGLAAPRVWWLTAFCAACTLNLASPPELAAGDWPHYRGSHYDGIAQESDLNFGSMEQAWKTNVGTGFCSIILADGRLFTMGNFNHNDTVFCLDPATGKEIWRYSYPEPLDPNMYEGGPNATPTYHDGSIFILSKSGNMFRLGAADGKVLWKLTAKELDAKPPTWGFAGAATVVGDMVLFNVGPKGTAVNIADGKQVWSSKGGNAGYAPPVPFKAGGKDGVAIFTGTHLRAVNPADGTEMWSYPWATAYEVNAAAPVFFGDKVFISSSYGKGCALLDLSGGTPTLAWENEHMMNHFSSSVFYEGHIYGLSGHSGRRSKLMCMDPATGEVVWSEGFRFGSVAQAGDKLVVLEDNGKLTVAIAQPEGYQMVASKEILDYKCWTVPVIAGGRLFARNAQGDLVSLALK